MEKIIILEAIESNNERPDSIVCIWDKKHIATVLNHSSPQYEQDHKFEQWQIDQITHVKNNFTFLFKNLIHNQTIYNGCNI